MPTQLNIRQRHANRLLAACKPLADVARFSGTCEATIRRWKKIPEFEAALERAARCRMVAAGRAFDRRVEKVIDATWKAQRELFAYIRGEIEIPFKRLIELRAALAAGERMLNQIRFSTRAKNRAELLLFMRKKGNSEIAPANPCNEEVNEISEDAQTPQNPPIFGHPFMGRGSRCHRDPQAADAHSTAMKVSAGESPFENEESPAGERLCGNEGQALQVRSDKITSTAQPVGRPRPSPASGGRVPNRLKRFGGSESVRKCRAVGVGAQSKKHVGRTSASQRASVAGGRAARAP